MTDQHPITPPPELVQQWLGAYFGTTVTREVLDVELALATQAARWGADQELEACCEWLKFESASKEWGDELRSARRPKPPSLKEQALEQLGCIQTDLNKFGMGISTDTIRRALEALPE